MPFQDMWTVKGNANSASAALNKWMKSYVPEGCVVHSFRHSFRDRLRALEAPMEVTDVLGGWSNRTITNIWQGIWIAYTCKMDVRDRDCIAVYSQLANTCRFCKLLNRWAMRSKRFRYLERWPGLYSLSVLHLFMPYKLLCHFVICNSTVNTAIMVYLLDHLNCIPF